jgi:hypothetical protein
MDMEKCGVSGCSGKVVGGFHAYERVATFETDGLLPISTIRWCREHEAALRSHARGSGAFFAA